MEDYAPSIFLRNWALVASYLCSRFCIFDRPILEEYVSQVEGGGHLLHYCLHVARYGLLSITRDIHPSFESLVVTNAPNLHASLMDFHHDTSLKSILEDDFISLVSRIHICSYLGNEGRAMVGC
jgi:hypothetical protein